MYVKQGDQISIIESAEFNKKLPVGNYLVQQNPMSGQFYLSPISPFTLPEKIYGSPEYYAKRYLATFTDRDNNLGVLLGGVKGTGKSLLAKMLCMQSNLPVLLITEPFGGTGFKQFLSQIREECVIFIDEFEKIYNNNELQQNLLSILDGVFEGKKLFLLTANTMKINEFLTNRPGRVYYSREYTGLSQDVINEVIDDLLVNKDNKENLLRDLMMVGTVNMDMLITIITEMNRYDETSAQSLSFLNIYPDNSVFNIRGKINIVSEIANPTRDSYGNVEDIPENYEVNTHDISGVAYDSPMFRLESFYEDFTYRDKKGELCDDRVHWRKSDLDIGVNMDSITITNKVTGDELIYKPIVKTRNAKISSDIFVKESAKRPAKADMIMEKISREQRGREAEQKWEAFSQLL